MWAELMQSRAVCDVEPMGLSRLQLPFDGTGFHAASIDMGSHAPHGAPIAHTIFFLSFMCFLVFFLSFITLLIFLAAFSGGPRIISLGRHTI
jgi:hypothetical protein